MSFSSHQELAPSSPFLNDQFRQNEKERERKRKTDNRKSKGGKGFFTLSFSPPLPFHSPTPFFVAHKQAATEYGGEIERWQ